MTPWIVAIAVGLAGLFYGLWQRARAKHTDAAQKTLKAAFDAYVTATTDQVHRLEGIVASQKVDLKRLEEAALAHLPDDALRARLTDILRPHTESED